MGMWIKEKRKDGTEIIFDEQGRQDYYKEATKLVNIIVALLIPVMVVGVIAGLIWLLGLFY